MIIRHFEVSDHYKNLITVVLRILLVNENQTNTILEHDSLVLLLDNFMAPSNIKWNRAEIVGVEEALAIFQKRSVLYSPRDSIIKDFEIFAKDLVNVFKFEQDISAVIKLNKKLLFKTDYSEYVEDNIEEIISYGQKNKDLKGNTKSLAKQSTIQNPAEMLIKNLINVFQNSPFGNRHQQPFSENEVRQIRQLISLGDAFRDQDICRIFIQIKEMGLKDLYVKLMTEYVWNCLLFRGWELAEVLNEPNILYFVVFMKDLQTFSNKDLQSNIGFYKHLENLIYENTSINNLAPEEITKPASHNITPLVVRNQIECLKNDSQCAIMLDLFDKFKSQHFIMDPFFIQNFECFINLYFNERGGHLVNQCVPFDSRAEYHPILNLFYHLNTYINLLSSEKPIEFSKLKKVDNLIKRCENPVIKEIVKTPEEEIFYKALIFPTSLLFRVIYPILKDTNRASTNSTRKIKRAYPNSQILP
jgi:hypothetical protein